MQIQTLVFGVLFVVFCSSPLGGQGGPPGGAVNDLLAVSGQPGLVYAGTDAGVFRSQDGGATWEPFREGLPLSRARSLAGGPEQLFVAVDDPNVGGIYRSRDGGAWEFANEGIPERGALSVAADPRNPDVVLAGTRNEGVFLSSDGGVSWAPAGEGLLDGPYVDIEFAPNDSQRIFATNTAGGLFETVDGGRTWTLPASSPGVSFRNISFDPADPNVVYVTTEAGLIRRPEEGASFELAPGSDLISFIEVAVDPADSAILYAATRSPFLFLVSRDRGDSWTPVGSGLPFSILPALIALPEQPTRLLGGAAGAGVFVSLDQAQTWTLSSMGLNAAAVTDLAVDPQNPQTLYAAVDGGGLFKSVNGGDSWNESRAGFDTGGPQTLAIDPVDPEVVYAGGVNPFDAFDGEALRSTDGGATWQTLFTGRPIFDIAASPDGRTVWFGADGGTAFFPAAGLFVSPDRGAQAQSVTGDDAILFGLDILQIAVDPQNQRNVYVVGEGFQSAFYWSDDEGDEFRPSASSQFRILDVAIDSNDPQRIYVAIGGNGVFRSDDAGRNFNAANGDLPGEAAVAVALAIDPEEDSAVYVSTSAGVFKSLDRGSTWSPAGAGLENQAVQEIRDAPQRSGVLYAATNGGGVFRTLDGGANWEATGGRIAFTAEGVVAAFDFAAGGVAPGEIVAIFGDNIGPGVAAQPGFDPKTGLLSTEASGARVLFNETPAPLFFVSARQINCQAPFELAGAASASIRIEVDGAFSETVSVPVLPSHVSVFPTPLNQDSTLNSEENPAPAGQVIQLFATGQGAVQPAVRTGAPAPSVAPLPAPELPVEVRIGGEPAELQFAGLAPGLVGLLQLNAAVPADLAPGEYEVAVQVGERNAAQPATLFVGEN